MANIIPFNLRGILERVAEIGPFQAVLYDCVTGRVRWLNEAARRGMFKRLPGLTGDLADVLHPEEAEAWMLEGKLILKSLHPLEYVEHMATDQDGEIVSSRSLAWTTIEDIKDRQLAYVQVSPASVRQDLVMRIIIPLDKPLQLAEEYMVSQSQGIGVATITSR